MNTNNPRGGQIDARVDISGDQSGQIAIGNQIEQQMMTGVPPTDAEVAELREQFRVLQRRVADR